MPWAEIIIGASLLGGFWVEGASFLATSLFLIFGAALAFNLARGLDISCGCFTSSAGEMINWWHVLRDASLMAMSLVVLISDDYTGSLFRLTLNAWKNRSGIQSS